MLAAPRRTSTVAATEPPRPRSLVPAPPVGYRPPPIAAVLGYEWGRERDLKENAWVATGREKEKDKYKKEKQKEKMKEKEVKKGNKKELYYLFLEIVIHKLFFLYIIIE
jgi:hypothetical protein